MLEVRVDIKGSKAIVGGFDRFAANAPAAVRRGLTRIVRGVHREAYDLLSGPGGDTGGYPVPVVTGHLRSHLDFLEPRQTKTANGAVFTTGDLDAMLFDSARYATVIHDGANSSSAHGPRSFADDALERFNEGDRMASIMDDELGDELKKVGK
ncbi:MAG: hypothetical protein OEV73_00120 [Desulfobulbaceae bacterium]|nr:hypothetical protein [Desulfobulbaceae bacterium]